MRRFSKTANYEERDVGSFFLRHEILHRVYGPEIHELLLTLVASVLLKLTRAPKS